MSGTMRPRLIVDCGGRILSALIVTADGALIPCSQEIRQTAMRHVPAEIAFDRRVTEHPDFLWDEAVDALSKVPPHQFFQRARRIGLHRSWDVDLTRDALRLASPLMVLSSAAALADPLVAPVLAPVAVAMLDAVLDPLFAFMSDRKLPPQDADAVAILPAHAGRHARLALQKIFRRRGFARLTIVSREIAAAMALTGTAATGCVVADVSEAGLHVYRVALEAEGAEQRFTTVAAATIPALSWAGWVQRITAAMVRNAELRQLPIPTPVQVDRALTALLSGAPQDAAVRLTHALLETVLGDEWRAQQRPEIALLLRELAEPPILAGEICGIDGIRRLLLDAAGSSECAAACDAAVLDRLVRGVAAATLWQRGDASRRVIVLPSGSLRINTFRDEAAEILSAGQLPAPGGNCHVGAKFAFRGAMDSRSPFLVHLLWGADRSAAGDATVCALRCDRGAAREDNGALRVSIHLRRSRNGHRLYGTVDAAGAGAAGVRSRFTHELPLFPGGGQ